MVSFRILGLAVFAGLSLAAPLQSDADSTAAELVPRQSTIWNDPYISKPYAFAAQKISNCNYQLTFRRFGFDSRHTLRFYATYPGSSIRRQVNPISSSSYTLSPTGSSDYGRYTVPNDYVISVHQFQGVCSSGTSGNAPSTFAVRSTDNGGYTYKNDWISPAFAPTTTTLPTPPTNVKIAKVAGTTGNYTVSWTPSSSATGGYYVLIRIDVYAYELSGYLPGTRTALVPAGQSSTTFKIYGRDRLSSVAVASQAGTDVVSDATKVAIVPAPSS